MFVNMRKNLPKESVPVTMNDSWKESGRVEAGNVYYASYSIRDAFYNAPPELLTARPRILEERSDCGSLLLSHRRIHEWHISQSEINVNAFNGEFKEHCLDQFWSIVPTLPPQDITVRFNPRDKCYFIVVNKQIKSHLCAFRSEIGGTDKFGLACTEKDIDVSMIWKLEESSVVKTRTTSVTLCMFYENAVCSVCLQLYM